METCEFQKKIHEMVPNVDDKIRLISTLLGAGGQICEHLRKTGALDSAPIHIKYFCSIIVGNILAFITDGHKGGLVMDKQFPQIENESEQEYIYRKFKYVIEELYESLQEMEKV